MFFANLFYFRVVGIIFAIIFFATPIAMTVTGDADVMIWLVFIIPYLLIYGIPVNIIANKRRKKILLEANLGLRLVSEVNKIKGSDYTNWNNKNKSHLEQVKKFIVERLTNDNKNSLDKIKNINEKISELNDTIKKEKSSTSDLIARHPFIQTLKDIQNRAN